MTEPMARLARAQRELEEARAVQVRRRRTLERVRSYAEETALDDEQLAKLALAEEELDRQVELSEARARKLEMEAMRLRARSRSADERSGSSGGTAPPPRGSPKA